PDARETIGYLRDEGVDVKVLSGDAPKTVGSIAADAGIEFETALDGRVLPTHADQVAEIARTASVVGRISPEGKRAIVDALTASGRYVAMIALAICDPEPCAMPRRAARGRGTSRHRTGLRVADGQGDLGHRPGVGRLRRGAADGRRR